MLVKAFGLFVRDVVLKAGLYFSIPFAWTGYSVKDSLVLLDAIHAAYSHPEYAPKAGVTYCNKFVNDVCVNMGFKELDGKLANDIVAIISKHPQWSEISIDRCQELANGGSLIVAGIREDAHGHVNVVCPGKEKTSGRWGAVPSVANVGKENFIGKGANWAFPSMPKFWVWRQTL